MEDIVELYAVPEACIGYDLHDLTERLKEADLPSFCVSLGDEDQDDPPQLPRYLPGAPNVMDDFHNMHQSSRFGGRVNSLSRIGLVEPRLEVLRL